MLGRAAAKQAYPVRGVGCVGCVLNNRISVVDRFVRAHLGQMTEDALWKMAALTYLRDVATAFNAFYRDCRIVGEETDLATARLQLARAARTVLNNGLTILGVSAPEQM